MSSAISTEVEAKINEILMQFIDDLKKQGFVSGHVFADSLPVQEAGRATYKLLRKTHKGLLAIILKGWPEPKDIAGNFDLTADGGIDVPEGERGQEHALKFAEWTGFNDALAQTRAIVGVKLSKLKPTSGANKEQV